MLIIQARNPTRLGNYLFRSAQMAGTNRLLCWVACFISRVQISDTTESGLIINRKVAAT